MKKAAVISALAIIAVAVGFTYFGTLANHPSAVGSFADCVKAGYPIFGQSPRNCTMPGGKRFSESNVVQATTNPCSKPGSCQFEITAKDNGRSFRYGVTSRFVVELDKRLYPVKELFCTPDGIIGQIASGLPSSMPAPLFAARFLALQLGSCVLKDRGFSVTISIVE